MDFIHVSYLDASPTQVLNISRIRSTRERYNSIKQNVLMKVKNMEPLLWFQKSIIFSEEEIH